MIEIIPAIDLIDGRCVRLTQGDFARKTVYGSDPLDIATAFEDAGVRRLHVVDLDGARSGGMPNLRVLERIAAATDLAIDFGGGVRTTDDVRSVTDAGAKFVVVGSFAVRNREEFGTWIDEFGGDLFLLGADVRDGLIAIDGWQTDTTTEVVPFLREMIEKGIKRAFVTDISRDGLLEGASGSFYSNLVSALPELELIASGGVTTEQDVETLALAGVSGVIIGKAFYEGRVDAARLVRLSESLKTGS